MKRYTYIILFILLLLVMAGGCTNSNSGNTSSEASLPQPNETVSPQPNETVPPQASTVGTPQASKEESTQTSKIVSLEASKEASEEETPQASEEETPQASEEETPQASEKETPQASETVYQDLAWTNSVQKYSTLIGADFTNSANSANNLDYASLATDGQNIVDDTQKALDENDKYAISSKYLETQKEWVSALEDYNSAGTYLIQIGSDGKTGTPNTEDITKATSLSNSGTGHLKRATALIKASA